MEEIRARFCAIGKVLLKVKWSKFIREGREKCKPNCVTPMIRIKCVLFNLFYKSILEGLISWYSSLLSLPWAQTNSSRSSSFRTFAQAVSSSRNSFPSAVCLADSFSVIQVSVEMSCLTIHWIQNHLQMSRFFLSFRSQFQYLQWSPSWSPSVN